MANEFDDFFDDGESIDYKKGTGGTTVADFSKDLVITDEYQKCLDIMERTQDNIFVTGDAGTGKSTLIKLFLSRTGKRVVVLAPTGVAAVNISGQTIHSFFRFPPKPLHWNNIPVVPDMFMEIYRKVETIIIDEISMVRVDLLDAIDMFFRKNLNTSVPFGGKQIIMVGDLAQLPPVISSTAEKEMIADNYQSPFFFSALVLTRVSYHKVRLKNIFRQTDKKFIDILNNIKNDAATQADIDIINETCYKRSIDMTKTTTICTTNKTADFINRMGLNSLPGELITLKGVVNGSFNAKNCPVDEEIPVKIGCKLMMAINDPDKRFYNGTIVELVDVNLKTNKMTVMLYDEDSTMIELERHEWESFNYTYDRSSKSITHKSTGSFVQFPIKLAYALTIHKAQGHTFDKINVDMGTGSFASGQTYVALSRCRTLEGISLTKKLTLSDVIFDHKIRDYLNSFDA